MDTQKFALESAQRATVELDQVKQALRAAEDRHAAIISENNNLISQLRAQVVELQSQTMRLQSELLSRSRQVSSSKEVKWVREVRGMFGDLHARYPKWFLPKHLRQALKSAQTKTQEQLSAGTTDTDEGVELWFQNRLLALVTSHKHHEVNDVLYKVYDSARGLNNSAKKRAAARTPDAQESVMVETQQVADSIAMSQPLPDIDLSAGATDDINFHTEPSSDDDNNNSSDDSNNNSDDSNNSSDDSNNNNNVSSSESLLTNSNLAAADESEDDDAHPASSDSGLAAASSDSESHEANDRVTSAEIDDQDDSRQDNNCTGGLVRRRSNRDYRPAHNVSRSSKRMRFCTEGEQSGPRRHQTRAQRAASRALQGQ